MRIAGTTWIVCWALSACGAEMEMPARMVGTDAGPALGYDAGPTTPPMSYDAGTTDPPPATGLDAGTTPVPTPPTPGTVSGCGQAPGANDREWRVSHGGRERSFFVHFPAGYNPANATPVVIDFHGRMGTPQMEMLLSHMVSLSDAEGFIAVHPAGVGGTWNGGFCCGEAMSSNIDDVGFISAMLDQLESQACVDTNRVFATGISNGGFMAHRLGCELADRIAAIGPVAGPLMMLTCGASRPVAVFHFHGTGDSIVPYDGFFGAQSVPGTMTGWASRNGCSGSSSVFFQEGDVRCEEWTGCNANATVRLCTIDGGGHQWPGGTSIPFLGDNTNVISASQMMWDFFEEHPMQR